MDNITTSIVFILVALGLYLGGADARNDAMTVCQLSHSYDVCFTALNK